MMDACHQVASNLSCITGLNLLEPATALHFKGYSPHCHYLSMVKCKVHRIYLEFFCPGRPTWFHHQSWSKLTGVNIQCCSHVDNWGGPYSYIHVHRP